MHLPPVHVAILAFRGARTLAAAIGKPHQRVIEWAKPYSLGGNDGEFPNPVIIKQVIAEAQARGITLNGNDLLWGKEVPVDQVVRELPPQARAPWWNLPPAPEHEPEPAPQRGR
jgi:hypothetical protein